MKLRVNKQQYKATEDFYYPLRYEKKRIVLLDTLRTGMGHIDYMFDQQDHRRVPAFTITRDGKVYQHFNPAFYTDVLGDRDLDREAITIMLENAGWLRSILENTFFINWAGDHVHPSQVATRKWRGHDQWQVYTVEQMESLAHLILRLCDKFSITHQISGSNTFMSNARTFQGVCSRSNFNDYNTDVNPFFNFMVLGKRLSDLMGLQEA